MPATTKERLGATTLNRDYYVDINAGTTEVPDWIGLFGITELKPLQEGTTQDDSSFDDEGWKSEANTAQSWGLEGKLKRAVTLADATAYDPGQEILRLAAIEMGLGNQVEIRYYEMGDGGPRVEAYQGLVGVAWSPEGGGMDALNIVGFKLAGRGRRVAITHPDAVTP